MIETLRQRLSSPHVSLLLILFFSLLLNIFGIWWGLLPGSPVDWGADTIAPVDVLDAARKLFSNGWHSRYPPFHFQSLTILYSPVFVMHKAGLLNVQSPSVYLLLFYLGRCLSIGMAIAVVIMVYRLARELKLNHKTAILSTVVTILNPLFVFYSKTTNLEIPYTTWLIASFIYAVRAFKNRKNKDYIFFAIFATFAVCTKDQAYGFYVLLIPVLIYNHWSNTRQVIARAWTSGISTARTFLIPLFAATILFIAIYNFPFNFQGFISHIKLIVGPASANYRIYPNTISGHLEMAIQSIRNIVFGQGWPFFIISVVGIVQALRRRETNPLIILPLISVLSYYIFFISIIGYTYDRFFLPTTILLSSYSGTTMSKFLDARDLPTFFKSSTVIAVLIYSFLYTASVDALLIADSRFEAHQWLTENIEDDAALYGIGKPYYLPPIYSHQFKQFDNHPTLEKVADFDPDFIIVSSIYSIEIFPVGSKEYRFFKELIWETSGYKQVFQYQGKPLFNLLNRDNVFTNIDKVNPEVLIFQKLSGE